jgi:hypothetical protein
MRLRWRPLHKWLAITAGIFLLSWVVSGVGMMAGRSSPRENKPAAVDLSEIAISPAQVLNRLSPGAQAKWIAIRRVAGRPVYELRVEDQGTVLIDAASGESLAFSAQLAGDIVRRQFPEAGAVTSAERLERGDFRYRTGPMPVWRVTLDGDSPAAYYVPERTGDVVRIDRWRVMQAVFSRVHDLSAVRMIGAGPAVQHTLLYLGSALAFVTAITGYRLALPLRKRANLHKP